MRTFTKCFSFLLALTILSVSAFAQLPSTCDYAVGAAPRHVAVATGALTFQVTAAAWSSGTSTATLTLGSTTGLAVGNNVLVSGLMQRGGTATSGYNGFETLTAVTASTVSYALTANPGTFTATTGAQVYFPGTVQFGVCVSGVVYQVPVFSTAFGSSQPMICHAQWNYTNDGGAISTITPVNGCTIPAPSAVIGAVVYNSTAAAGTSGTMSIGWGSSHAAIMSTGIGAVANLSGGVFMQTAVYPQGTAATPTYAHLTTPQAINFTIATTAFTQGVVDVYVLYVPMAL